MGLLSPGGVHSQEEHLFAILEFAKKEGIENLYLHAFGDGRDVKPKSIIASIKKVDKFLIKYGYK
jgi:2,3-bisphosphoglycerate-independent phosphoglycerate mutase